MQRHSEARFGSFATGWNQRQVQPCPLFADRYRSGEPLNPTRRANNGSGQHYSIT
jgi:hypothetical protein